MEPYWPGLFAKALEGISVKDLITNVGSGVGAGPAPGGGGGGGGNYEYIIFGFLMCQVIYYLTL